ncbi:MAG: ATP synthase subunit beta, partial [Candidatus Giovannonibacteria bacterium GW2011_GWA2_53_7]
MKQGTITQIIGPVVDVRFEDHLPEIYHSLEVKLDGQPIILEVQQHLGGNAVRTVSMASTDGLSRGLAVIDRGVPISVPVGEATLGRMFNVVGDPIDGQAAPQSKERAPIHHPAPAFTDQSTNTEILETGIKVIDLIAPII